VGVEVLADGGYFDIGVGEILGRVLDGKEMGKVGAVSVLGLL
jgi:hypothetical protein